jgi:hypothetical protein
VKSILAITLGAYKIYNPPPPQKYKVGHLEENKSLKNSKNFLNGSASWIWNILMSQQAIPRTNGVQLKKI